MIDDSPESESSSTAQLEAVGREAARVAHDLSNLLQIIVGFGDVLAAELPADSPQHRAATNILNAATTATARARQLVALGRRARALPALLDASVAILAVTPALRRRCGDRLRLRLTLPDTPMPIRISAATFEQLLLQLIVPTDGACDGTRTLAIGVARLVHADDDAAARQVPAGSYIEVMVRDTCAAAHDRAPGVDDLDLLRPDGGYLLRGRSATRDFVVRVGFPEPAWDPDAWTEPSVRDAPSTSALPMAEMALLLTGDVVARDALAVALTRAGYQVADAFSVSEAEAWLAESAADTAVVLCDSATLDTPFAALARARGVAVVPMQWPCTPPTLVAAIRDAATS